MTRTTTILCLGMLAIAGLGTLLLMANPALAHHAFGAEFDRDAPVKMTGTITKLEWVNPHTWIHLEVEEIEGPVSGDRAGEVWMVEGGTPNVLLRRGLHRDCLTPGTEIVVDGYQAKDHSLNRANGRDITFTDGTKIFLGSSGTGAPYEEELRRARRERGRC